MFIFFIVPNIGTVVKQLVISVQRELPHLNPLDEAVEMRDHSFMIFYRFKKKVIVQEPKETKEEVPSSLIVEFGNPVDKNYVYVFKTCTSPPALEK